MKHFFLLLALGILPAGVTMAQDFSGNWIGQIKAGDQFLRLRMHIYPRGELGYEGALDSLNQNVNGIPASKIITIGVNIVTDFPSINATYDAEWDSVKDALLGDWKQNGTKIPVVFMREHSTEGPKGPLKGLEGIWQGSLETGGPSMRMVLQVKRAPQGGYTATFDSIDEGAHNLPVNEIGLYGTTLHANINKIGASYNGEFDPETKTVKGSWSQGANSVPMVLTKVDKVPVVRRPQTPHGPFPYRSVDMTFPNPVSKETLGGTLTLPQGQGPFPAVLLITGSGPQDRDETLLEHKPFLVIADYLTRRGIAVLRVDDRGIGKSTGKFETATTADFATDTEAALAYLKTRPEVDPKHIGLIGHSEGGIIAPMVAARHPEVAFIVTLAGTGIRGDEVLLMQSEQLARTLGMPPGMVSSTQNARQQIYTILRTERDSATAEAKIRKLVPEVIGQPDPPAAVVSQVLQQFTNPWIKYFAAYDPSTAWRKVKCPVLALNGEKDTQVDAEVNLGAIRRALKAGGNQSVQTKEFPKLNHLFQTAATGAPAEYGQIEETIAPAVLEEMGTWIAAHAKS